MDQIASLAGNCRVATPHDAVLNSECAYTFHSPFTSEKGIVVSLNTFVGTVEELAFSPGGNSGEETGLFVRIVKKRVEKPHVIPDEDDGGEKNVTKLGIGVEGGFAGEDDKFETTSTHSVVLMRKSGPEIVAELPFDSSTKDTFPSQVALSVESIINHSGLAVQQDLKAWELDDDPKPVSKYCENLPFVDNGVKVKPEPSEWKCEKSGDTENLWLNLSDGYIGGGRKNWDGSGGSNGALDHFNETGQKYPLVVKLGTITADIDTADCYSYAKDEDGPVKIPNLAELLEKRGINVSGMMKTVKSTAELEVELNATYAFDAITEKGANLVPVSGAGLQGLQNLGNSCYINSVVQMLFGGSVPELSSRYGTTANGSVTSNALLNIPTRDASSDLLCQTAKLSCALTSGTFAGPVAESAVVTDTFSSSSDPKYRLAPRMFKHVVGKDHVDFRTGQQQDSAQFMQHLIEKLDRAELGAGSGRLPNKVDASSPTPVTSNLFSFKTISRIICNTDDSVKYMENAPETMLSLRIPMDMAEKESSVLAPEQKRHKIDVDVEGAVATADKEEIPTVTFRACLMSWAALTSIEGLRWPHLANAIHPAMKQTRFANFPRYLVIQIQRYEHGPDWTPRKLEVNIDMPHDIDLNEFKSTGPQDGENLVPEGDEDGASPAPSEPQIDEAAVGQLMDMGFSMNGCKRALTAVGGSNVEAAMNWIFEHNSDPDFNDPLPETTSGASSGASGDDIDDAVVMSLVSSLGCFTADQVRASLKATGGAPDRAADWLFSHMDDLDGAISALSNNAPGNASGSSGSSAALEDGDGKYELVGLVSHIGKHTGSGHYVAHIKKDGKWVIFNDEKVAISESPPFQHAYLYLFQRKDSIGAPNPSY